MMVVTVVVIVLVVPLFFFFVPLVVEAFVQPLSCDIDRAARTAVKTLIAKNCFNIGEFLLKEECTNRSTHQWHAFRGGS